MKNQVVTKETVEFIVKNWDSMRAKEIAEKLNVSEHHINYTAQLIRRAGHPLKHHSTLPKNRQGSKNVVRGFLESIGIKLS